MSKMPFRSYLCAGGRSYNNRIVNAFWESDERFGPGPGLGRDPERAAGARLGWHGR